MAIYANNRQEIRHDLSDGWFGDLITGSPSAVASGTADFTGRDFMKPNDFFNTAIDMYVYAGRGLATIRLTGTGRPITE